MASSVFSYLLYILLIAHITVFVASTPTQSHKPKLANRKALLISSNNAEKKSIVLAPKRNLILEDHKQSKLIKSNKTNATTSNAKIKLHNLKSTDDSKSSKFITHNSTNATKIQLKKPTILSTSNPIKTEKDEQFKPKSKPILSMNKLRQHDELSEAEDPSLITEFRSLPSRLQKTLLPDLERISTTSKAYLYAANAGVIQTVTPFLDTRYIPQIAPLASALLIILTLLLFITIVRRLGSCLFLLQCVQSYLAIYFATLALVAILTGQEPLTFFHVTSPNIYTWTQMAQSIGYIAYLLLQLSDLVVVFESAANGEMTKALGLLQMALGLGVGLHYYTAVFHQAAAGEAPLSTWQVHAVYASCFMVICVCSRMDRRKKVYAGTEGEEDCKNS